MTSKEQELLKEDHEKIWATITAVDTNVATALKRNLEVSAAELAQMRQDGMNVHRLVAEVQAMIEQHLDQQKIFEKMVIANGVLESTQISMATEIAALKLEIHNLQNERGSSQTTAEDGTLETSAVVLSSSTYLSGGLVPPATFAQREIYILGGLADIWLESVIVYARAMNQMRNAAPMLAPRSYAASLLDGNIYFIWMRRWIVLVR